MADLFECLDDLGRELSEKMDCLLKKATDISEIRYYNSQIRDVERENAETFQMIGKYIYKKYMEKQELGEELTELCSIIQRKDEFIHLYKKKIAEIKRMEICSNCGEFIPNDANYCPKCGTKKDKCETAVPEVVRECE